MCICMDANVKILPQFKTCYASCVFHVYNVV